MLDIVMTATLRSNILERTLFSFKENMFHTRPCRLIINIDPVGDDTVENVINVAKKYFDVLVNVADTPNFSKAYKWVFEQSKTRFIFHLEDDWELLKPVDLDDMIDIMYKYPTLATLRLPYRISTHQSKNWSTFFKIHPSGRFFICPPKEKISVGYCGHPALVRGSFIRKCLPYINTKHNPEKQFHIGGSYNILRTVNEYDYAVYQRQNESEYIKDIGRHWLIKTKWRKKGIKAFFNEWERIPENEIKCHNTRGK
jgi:hypothetical protein